MPPSNLIDGRAIAEQIHAETAQRIAALKARGIQPGLAFVRVGEDPASKVYVGMKERTSGRLGIFSQTKVLSADAAEVEVLALLEKLNAYPRIHGILVQAPLPSPICAAQRDSSPARQPEFSNFLFAAKLTLRAPKQSSWAGATLWANRWPRSFCKNPNMPTPP